MYFYDLLFNIRSLGCVSYESCIFLKPAFWVHRHSRNIPVCNKDPKIPGSFDVRSGW